MGVEVEEVVFVCQSSLKYYERSLPRAAGRLGDGGGGGVWWWRRRWLGATEVVVVVEAKAEEDVEWEEGEKGVRERY